MGKRGDRNYRERMQAAAGVGRGLPLPQFLETHVRPDKGPFTFQGHEPFRQVVADIERVFAAREPGVTMTILKGAQIGATTCGVGVSLYAAVEHGRNVGYFLPTNVFAERFDKTRFRPLVLKSPLIRQMERQAEYKGTQAAMLREFNGAFWYGLGLESIHNAISIPLDVGLYDEVDVLPTENMEWSRDRFAHSELRFRLFYSVGMSPGLGIDALYQDSCMHKWRIRCPHCRRDDVVLEELFESVEVVRRVGGAWRYVCPGCGGVLDPAADGRWVADHPSRIAERRLGYRMPELIFSAVSLDYIMDYWAEAQTRPSQKAKFRCSVLAAPDAGSMQPITDAVLALARTEHYEPALRTYSRPVVAGVDTGDSVHFAAGELIGDDFRWIWFEEIDADRMEERLSFLMRALGVAALVCDSKPLRNSARRLAYEFPKKVWLQDFGPDFATEKVDKTDDRGERRQYQRVVVNRDESLDGLCDLFSQDGVSRMKLPAATGRHRETLIQVAAHLKNLQKEKHVDARGNTHHSYRRNVANHFGMAMNSAVIAARLAGIGGRRGRKGKVTIV